MRKQVCNLSVTAAFLCLLLFLTGGGCTSVETPGPSTELQRHEFSQPEMGIPFRIVLYATSAAQAQIAARAAFQRIRQLNDTLSDYDADSELSRLSRSSGNRQPVKVSPDLWRMLDLSQALAQRTDGAFDITVGRYVNLWRKARRVRQLPSAQSLREAQLAVGYRKLVLNPQHQTAELLAPDMRLDLGAIAKGYAVDEALKVLRQMELPRALVTGGGDMAAGEPPPGRNGWRVEVAPLDVPQAPPARFVSLRNAGLATSGDVFQHVEIGGKRYSHIVDPRTGLGLTDHSLVTVIARDCTTADSLATTISVLGPQAGLKLVDETRGAAALVVRMPGDKLEVFESPRMSRHYERQGRKL